LSCLYAFTCAGTGLFFQDRKSILKYLSACVAAVLFYLPHWSITMAQFSQGGIGHSQDGWLAAPDKWALFGFLKTLFGTGYVWLVFLVLGIVGFILNRELKVNKKTIVLLILFFVNYFLIYFYSILKAPIFQYSVMLFSAPCFIWAVTSSINFKPKWGIIASVIVSLILIWQSVIGKNFFSNAVLNQNGTQSEMYCEVADKYGKENVESYYMASQKFFVIDYELKYKRKFNYFIGEDFVGIESFKDQIRKSKAKYILIGEPTRMQLEIAKEYFPAMLEHYQSLNVNVYLLFKGESVIGSDNCADDDTEIAGQDKFEINFNKEKLIGNNYFVDSLNEFCYSAKGELTKLNLKEGNVILAKVKVQSKDQLNGVSFNYSISNAKDSTLFFGGPDIGRFYTSDSTGYYAYSEIFIGSDLKYWLSQDAKLTFFIWNRSKKKFVLSDFEIQIIDYWSARWSWWK
jgi:hypothetical protein